MDLLLKLTPQDQVQKHVLPMITKSLEAQHGQLQVCTAGEMTYVLQLAIGRLLGQKVKCHLLWEVTYSCRP